MKEEPEVNIVVNHGGLTISSKRFDTPRFVPFEVHCKTCKTTSVTIDFVISNEGISIQCPKFKSEKFLNFDRVYDMPRKTFISVKTRSSTFQIPINNEEIKQEVE